MARRRCRAWTRFLKMQIGLSIGRSWPKAAIVYPSLCSYFVFSQELQLPHSLHPSQPFASHTDAICLGLSYHPRIAKQLFNNTKQPNFHGHILLSPISPAEVLGHQKEVQATAPGISSLRIQFNCPYFPTIVSNSSIKQTSSKVQLCLQNLSGK